MRHAKARYQLNRFTSWRRATLISLARSLFLHQSIKTTKTKAKAVRPLVEKLISLAKSNNLAGKRQVYKILGEHQLVNLLFNEIGPRFNNRAGGYTRIIGFGSRRGDNAEMVLLELTEIKKKEKRKPKKETKPELKKEEKPEIGQEKPLEELKKTETAVKEKPPIIKKPAKKFFRNLGKIFKKESDSL